MSKPAASNTITALDTQYTMLVKLEYSAVPLNVGNPIGHHVTPLLPVTCNYGKKK